MNKEEIIGYLGQMLDEHENFQYDENTHTVLYEIYKSLVEDDWKMQIND